MNGCLEIILTITTVIAAVASAIAAFLSFCVTRKAQRFQANLVINQNILNEFDRAIYKAERLHVILSWGAKSERFTDEKEDSIEPSFEQLKFDLERFGNRGLFNYHDLKISKMNTMHDLVKNPDSLINAIQAIDEAKSRVLTE